MGQGQSNDNNNNNNNNDDVVVKKLPVDLEAQKKRREEDPHTLSDEKEDGHSSFPSFIYSFFTLLC